MTGKLKYVVYPGYVRSKTDGDRRYIDSRNLMRLYKVRPDECMVIHADMNDVERQQRESTANQLKLRPLVPLYHGNYAARRED
jgi:hypothetical protein